MSFFHFVYFWIAFSVIRGECKSVFEGSLINELYRHNVEYENTFYNGKNMIFIIQDTNEHILSPLDLEIHLRRYVYRVKQIHKEWRIKPKPLPQETNNIDIRQQTKQTREAQKLVLLSVYMWETCRCN